QWWSVDARLGESHRPVGADALVCGRVPLPHGQMSLARLACRNEARRDDAERSGDRLGIEAAEVGNSGDDSEPDEVDVVEASRSGSPVVCHIDGDVVRDADGVE